MQHDAVLVMQSNDILTVDREAVEWVLIIEKEVLKCH